MSRTTIGTGPGRLVIETNDREVLRAVQKQVRKGLQEASTLLRKEARKAVSEPGPSSPGDPPGRSMRKNRGDGREKTLKQNITKKSGTKRGVPWVTVGFNANRKATKEDAIAGMAVIMGVTGTRTRKTKRGRSVTQIVDIAPRPFMHDVVEANREAVDRIMRKHLQETKT